MINDSLLTGLLENTDGDLNLVVMFYDNQLTTKDKNDRSVSFTPRTFSFFFLAVPHHFRFQLKTSLFFFLPSALLMSSLFPSLFLFMLLSVPVSRQACVVFGPRRAKAAWLTSSRLLRGRMSLHIGLPSHYASAHTQQTDIQGGKVHVHTHRTEIVLTQSKPSKSHIHTCTRSRWAEAIFSLAARTQSHIQQEIHRASVYENAAYFGVVWSTTGVGQRLIHAVTSDRLRMEGQSDIFTQCGVKCVKCWSRALSLFFLFFLMQPEHEWPQSITSVHIKMQIYMCLRHSVVLDRRRSRTDYVPQAFKVVVTEALFKNALLVPTLLTFL